MRVRRPRAQRGEALSWLCGGALALDLLGIAAIVLLLAWNGFAHFWQPPLLRAALEDGRVLLGEVFDRERIPGSDAGRLRLKVGNRDLTGSDFVWVDDAEINAQSYPPDALVLERLEWGNFYGVPVSLARGTQTLARGVEAVAVLHALQASGEDLEGVVLAAETADGKRLEIPADEVVRALLPNSMSVVDLLVLYGSRIVEFVSTEPRESNTEGGIFPAIFGTVLLVFLMTVFVTPLGVLAALYLHEYAPPGPAVRILRVAVNNLAGVPSIVFGVFGLGFFVYFVGGSIDQLLYSDSLPSPTFGTGGILWASLTLALLTVPVVVVATEEGLSAVPRAIREASLALGATRFETTWRIVVPAATQGILTGVILAMARAAGEVAPLMVVGVVKLAPSLPLDGQFPYAHLERKFMHLGFHIYDVGFQSPNAEATTPLVFATALLLVGVVIAMNTAAIALRSRLRRRYATSAV